MSECYYRLEDNRGKVTVVAFEAQPLTLTYRLNSEWTKKHAVKDDIINAIYLKAAGRDPAPMTMQSDLLVRAQQEPRRGLDNTDYMREVIDMRHDEIASGLASCLRSLPDRVVWAMANLSLNARTARALGDQWPAESEVNISPSPLAFYLAMTGSAGGIAEDILLKNLLNAEVDIELEEGGQQQVALRRSGWNAKTRAEMQLLFRSAAQANIEAGRPYGSFTSAHISLTQAQVEVVASQRNMTVQAVLTQLSALAGRVEGGIAIMARDGVLGNGNSARATAMGEASMALAGLLENGNSARATAMGRDAAFARAEAAGRALVFIPFCGACKEPLNDVVLTPLVSGRPRFFALTRCNETSRKGSLRRRGRARR